MRVIVFETEPHEAGIFEGLKGRHQLRLIPEPPGAANERWNFSLFPDMNQRPCEMFYRTLVSADIL